ncbi:NUDIX hydrolase [Caloranaerobacter sp. DY30410]|uniref:NUDIX hydrolase n=1 Tax=Caloranaerobacter sp. DY30410 TaxID=3238305 RepID=UPI003D068C5D
MSRQPINVLVFPYFISNNGNIKYALFKRSDMNCWQGIAGGVEEGENILDAVKRECWEEANIDIESEFIKLDSMTSIPITEIKGDWDDNTYVATEYSYGVKLIDKKIVLSNEHNEFGWFTYEEAMKLLKWDSNKTALWELNKRLVENKEEER